MSDPVKNSDVEDVLFSIRRLVSDAPSAEADTQEAAKEDTSNALFLTSAHRVHDPATEPEQVELEDMTSGFSHFRNAVDQSQAEELPAIEEMFADKNDQGSERRLHLSEVVSDPVDRGEEFIEDIEEETSEVVGQDVSEAEDRKWSEDPDVDTLGEFATPEDTFGAEAVETSGETDESAQSDTEEPVWEDEETALDFEFNEAMSETDTTDDAQSDASDFEEPVAEETPFEHDEVAEEPVSEESHDDADFSELEDVPEDVEEIDALSEEPQWHANEETPKDTPVDLADFDETVVDEDAMRDMVAEIVRQELSGELGERITRNVRKLVRREIHRALIARDFD